MNYTAIKDTASSLIKNFGRSVSIVQGTSSYVVATGINTVTETTTTANAVEITSKYDYRLQTSVQEGERAYIVSTTLTLKPGDKMTVGSASLIIRSANPIQPSSTVIYWEVVAKEL